MKQYLLHFSRIVLCVVASLMLLTPPAFSSIQSVRGAAFEQEVLASSKPVLSCFTANWAGPSVILVHTLEDIADDYTDTLKISLIDWDANFDISHEYRVRNIPTCLFFKKGMVEDQFIGYKPTSQIQDFIERNL